jgi:hypothetical protein
MDIANCMMIYSIKVRSALRTVLRGWPVSRALQHKSTINAALVAMAIDDIDHTKTTVKSPQTKLIFERFHKTILQEFYQVAFRKKLYDSIDALQVDLDEWLHHYNHERTHQGKICCDSIRKGWVAVSLMPLIDGPLAGDDSRSSALAFFGDFQQIAAFWCGQDREAPVVEDQ